MSDVITRAKALQAHILNMDSGSGDAALIGELIASLEAVIEERNVQTDLRQIAEDTADELRARLEAVEKRAEAARWNVDEDGNLVRLCRGDHDKDENCSDHEELFVPLARAERAEAALATARRDAELLNKIVLPMVEQRSREQKDAWDQAAAAIRALANEAET